MDWGSVLTKYADSVQPMTRLEYMKLYDEIFYIVGNLSVPQNFAIELIEQVIDWILINGFVYQGTDAWLFISKYLSRSDICRLKLVNLTFSQNFLPINKYINFLNKLLSKYNRTYLKDNATFNRLLYQIEINGHRYLNLKIKEEYIDYYQEKYLTMTHDLGSLLRFILWRAAFNQV